MPFLLAVFYLGAAAIGLFWLVRLFLIEWTGLQRPRLHAQSYPEPPQQPPRVSVVVAAKDEEDNIEACVRSLLAQDYPDFELIVIDDRSGDNTPEILDRLGSEGDERLRVLTIEALPEGWFGKAHAVWRGVEASSGDWLLFTDADCRYTSPKALSLSVSEAVAHDADFLSVIPELDTPTVWERVLQPVCALTLIVWFLPHRVNNPAQKTAYANGAFMLIRRKCYEAIGGHESVRTEVSEDVRLAWLTKRMGMDLRVVESDGLYRTRMYDTLRGAWNGWSRIFSGCLRRVSRLMIAAWLLVLLSILPWALAVVALIGVMWVDAPGRGSWTPAAGAWFAVVAMQQIVHWRLYGRMRLHPLWSLTYVLGAVATVVVLCNAMLKVVGATPVVWRGTRYRCAGSDAPLVAASDGAPAGPTNKL